MIQQYSYSLKHTVRSKLHPNRTVRLARLGSSQPFTKRPSTQSVKPCNHNHQCTIPLGEREREFVHERLPNIPSQIPLLPFPRLRYPLSQKCSHPSQFCSSYLRFSIPSMPSRLRPTHHVRSRALTFQTGISPTQRRRIQRRKTSFATTGNTRGRTRRQSARNSRPAIIASNTVRR